MATHLGTQAPSNSTDAYFRLWGGEISTQLAALGLVKASDVGQIDWVTVTAPVASNTVQGFEIWMFDDTLQATKPVYVKVEYGSGSAANTPSLWITVGDGSDGAGSLTGATSTRVQVKAASNTTTLKNNYYSCDDNRMGLCLFQDNTSLSYTILVNIERTKDSVGTDNGDGVLINYNTNGGSAWGQQYLQLGVGATTAESRWGVLAPSVGTGSGGADVAIYSVWLTRGTYLNPPLGVMGAFRADMSGGSVVPLNHYSSTHYFYCTGSSTQAIQAGTTANPVSVLFRYE